MRTRTWKVPTVLLAAALVGACGGDAESADDVESQRVIPAAEPSGDRTAETAPEPPAAPAAEEAAQAARAESPGIRTAPEPAASSRPAPQVRPAPDEPVSTPPTAVVRTDPEPSVAPSEPVEMRPETEPAPEPEAVPEPEPLTAPPGTRVTLTVGEELSTRVSRTGDLFDATVAEDVLGGDGVVLLPRGTRMRGRVLESFESPDSDRPATLALGVESMELAGRLVPVAATVVELEHETEAKDSDTRSAAKVGAGAVAGALLGKIIGGDGKDAVKGAVAGALAGAAVAHATRDGHAKVPRGARMVIVLDERLVVEPPAATIQGR